jgi:hypothetical protein
MPTSNLPVFDVKRATTQKKPSPKLVVHPIRGSQFEAFVAKLPLSTRFEAVLSALPLL